MRDEDFHFVRKVLREDAGIEISDQKRSLVYGRVVRSLRKRKLPDFAAYLSLIRNGDKEVRRELINSLTTNFTSFFRESHHFDFLSQKGLRAMMAGNGSERTLRIWSAGCSSGEEPYTLAMTLTDCKLDMKGWDVRILATDLDDNVLAKAASGVYERRSHQTLDEAILRRHFLCGAGAASGKIRVKPELRKMVSFRKLNLMHDWPMKGKFDLIMCRNVMIYFDRPTQMDLIRKYADNLKPHGYLMIGHSESVEGLEDILERVDQRTYKVKR